MSSQSKDESRKASDRRGEDRRQSALSYDGPDRRKGDRRSGKDRRQTRRSA